MRIGRVIAGMFLAATVFVPVANAQTVNHVDVTVAVDEKAVLDITEVWEITVRAGAELEPIERVAPFPDTAPSDFEILEVSRDGKPATWVTDANGDLLSLTVVTTADDLEPGIHRYVFRYRVADFVISEPRLGALVWAFWGYKSGFEFNLESTATFTIAGPPFMFVKIFKAEQSGSFGNNTTTVPVKIFDVGSSQHAVLSLSAGLATRNNFLVNATFDQGFAGEQTKAVNLYESLFRIDGIWGPLPLAVTLCFFLVAIWLARHRQPRVTENLSEPLSPAVMRFLDRGAYDPAVLTAAFLNLVHRNRIQLRPLPDGSIEAIRGPDTSLPSIEFEEERHIVADLFPEGMTAVPISFTGKNHFKTIHEHFRREIDRRLRGKRERRIQWFLSIGYLIACFSLFLPLLDPESPEGMSESIWDALFPMLFCLYFSSLIVSVGKLFRDGVTRANVTQLFWAMFGALLGVYFLWRYLMEGIGLFGYGLLIHMGVTIFLAWILERELNRRFVPPPDAARQIDAMRKKIADMVQSRTDGSAGTPLPDDLIPYAVALDRQGHWTWAVADRIRKLLDPKPAAGKQAWYDNDNIGLVQFGKLAPSLRNG